MADGRLRSSNWFNEIAGAHFFRRRRGDDVENLKSDGVGERCKPSSKMLGIGFGQSLVAQRRTAIDVLWDPTARRGLLYIDDHQYIPMEAKMSRVQLALNVQNLQDSIAFYSKMFGTQPAKVREGYANFAISEPPLKLVLIETKSDGTSEYQHLNHLGVELESPQLVEQAIDQFSDLGLVEKIEKSETCCYAVQDKVWMTSPDGAPWEYYTVLADAPTFRANIAVASGGDCCS